MNLAPVVIFTYKRLDTLKDTIEALKRNTLSAQTDLIFYSDGGKKESDWLVINEIRSYLHTVDGFKSVVVYASGVNKGLAISIIQGVSQTLEKYESIIVLEDDLRTTANFLEFMNQSLKTYRENENVFSISGYSFNLGRNSANNDDAYFLNRGWSWGWAPWKNRWLGVDWAMQDYDRFAKDKYARKNFSKGGSDLNAMLDKQMNGQLDSWAIRWFYHQFKVNGLTLYPVESKVYNNGFDEEATHTNGSASRYIPNLDVSGKTSFSFPPDIQMSAWYQKRFASRMGILARIKSKVETLFKRFKNVAR